MKIWVLACALLVLTACSEQQATEGQGVYGQWIKDNNGRSMLDPQPSGLVEWRGRLLFVSDGSAADQQKLKLHRLRKTDATLAETSTKMTLGPDLANSCFASYLSDSPDLEALTVDPRDDRVVFAVTEDATRSGSYSFPCRTRFSLTGSTDYPTLLIRIYLNDDQSLTITHVRPLQFNPRDKVGNFPNDGIEGMAFSPDGTLYLGLEKDEAGVPRIFKTKVNANFWESDDFAPVKDARLKLPVFDSGVHPINGMDYIKVDEQNSYLIAAARNDDELWIIDTNAREDTKRVKLHFLVPTPKGSGCPAWEVMDNASIEGVAIDGQTLWLVNDPWKVNYMKNVQCEANRANYKAMAGLLFKLDIDPAWFE